MNIRILLLVYPFLTACVTMAMGMDVTLPTQYVGNLSSLYKKAGEDLNVLYQGQIIKPSEGFFVFKNITLFQPVILLFIDPDEISVSSNENTVWYLTTTTKASYQAFECALTPQFDGTVSFYWVVREAKLPASFDEDNPEKLIIPYNTLIIPLAPCYYQCDENGKILFEIKKIKCHTVTIDFPTPLGVIPESDTIKRMVQKANMALINLRPIHAEQEAFHVRRDYLRVTLLK